MNEITSLSSDEMPSKLPLSMSNFSLMLGLKIHVTVRKGRKMVGKK